MDLGLRDKVAFIAGSSRGIGLAIAIAFLREGSHVVISGRSAESLEEARKLLLKEADAQQVLAVQGDMVAPPHISLAIDKTLATFHRIDAVVANVGNGAVRSGWNVSVEDWRTTFSANLFGGMILASAALPHLIAGGGGSLTFVSSIAGCEAINAPVTYSAAKAAAQSAVKNLSRLVALHGVRVNAVAPGNVLFPGGSWERRLAERREFYENYILTEVPLQRFGRPEEVADAVVFLASERASFITGACLVVDGGQTRSFF